MHRDGIPQQLGQARAVQFQQVMGRAKVFGLIEGGGGGRTACNISRVPVGSLDYQLIVAGFEGHQHSTHNLVCLSQLAFHIL